MEILVATAIIALLFAAALISYLGGILLLTIGVAFIIAGLSIGVPAGVYYHILLFRRKGLLEEGLKGWWISPQRYHRYLPEKDRKLLNRWFWIGAAFFNMAMIGCGLVFVGLLAR